MTTDCGTVLVGLVQVSNSFSGQSYLPYSVGLLQAYVQEHAERPERYAFLLPIYRRLSVGDAVAQLGGADVVCFSAYVWNVRLSLEIARRIKLESPSTLVVFGGPQIPDRAGPFLLTSPFVDVICHGEGEQVLLAILERYPSRDWTGVPSISYIADDGSLVQQGRAPRLRDLSLLPSPYLERVFDPLIDAHSEETWIALWETNRGCPFSCAFCDWGSAVGTHVAKFDMGRLREEMDWFADRRIEFIFCCDANFGILPRDVGIARYAAEIKRLRGYPHALSVQNTKNVTDRAYEVQRVLAEAGLNKGVTLSLQSTHPDTLEAVGRQNISVESFQDLQNRFSKAGIETYTDLILGLPGETYDTFVEGVSQVIASGQHNRIQFNNLSVMPNAKLADPAYQAQWGVVTVESPITNVHGAIAASEDEVQEFQTLVVATKSMPEEDWARARAFGWWAALLHFDKLLQIPLILLHNICKIPYHSLVEAFADGATDRQPVLAETRAFLLRKARELQRGGPEYCPSEEWLRVWWPADEFVLIKLCMEQKLSSFYGEAGAVLAELAHGSGVDLPDEALDDALRLNEALVKLPLQTDDLTVSLSWNVHEVWRAAMKGATVDLKPAPSQYCVDRTSETWGSWDDWCREVVWYGNKKGAYLYGAIDVEANVREAY